MSTAQIFWAALSVTAMLGLIAVVLGWQPTPHVQALAAFIGAFGGCHAVVLQKGKQT